MGALSRNCALASFCMVICLAGCFRVDEQTRKECEAYSQAVLADKVREAMSQRTLFKNDLNKKIEFSDFQMFGEKSYPAWSLKITISQDSSDDKIFYAQYFCDGHTEFSADIKRGN
ncbi:MAG: hypothetical protein QM766_04915 [Burkholderiaceae bacterium]